MIQSVLSYLPGHVTRFLMPHNTAEIDYLIRLNVIQIRSAVQWLLVFAFFPLFYTTCQKVFSRLKWRTYCMKNSSNYNG